MIKNGRGVIRGDTRSPRRRRRHQRQIASVLVAGTCRVCFTWRRRSITLGDLLAGAKDVPSGCTVACILFVHFVHTVKAASRKASPCPGARTGRLGKSRYTSTYGVVALSFCTLERRRSGDTDVYTWTKKDLHENRPENRIISRLKIL